ncbi:MAG: class I SAM-dependent methyltransferase [Chloroflexi bacterium]|nr:class I SAM-dependent methyltransferase [Chloroflexota bacterium]MCI0579629.1 class I SAM-dependent methyltransferase [Chloroflexota bacterium]MCI0643566.1 class I SAM-dependent methyltransferase [Chloroflexota bacterium]MCI0726188.1 class I SAM-dependent methyltransferase [Chloroflexota bacterium]
MKITEKYAQPEVVAFWKEFSHQGLQACEAEMLARYAPPPARVLDLGCGSGRAGLALASQGYDVHGLDITWEMVWAARETYTTAGLKLPLVQGDIQAIPCAPASFDVALILIAALQHIPGRKARQRVFANIGRVLRPGGALILALDNVAPALTCYAWWGWQRLRSPSPQPAASQATNGATPADALLGSHRQGLSSLGWHARGLARTLRWRTWTSLLDLGRRAGVWPGEVGDTAINQVSLQATQGRVFYHFYQYNELVADAAVGGLRLIGYHSGRELTEGKEFAPRVRQLDKQVLYAFHRK